MAVHTETSPPSESASEFASRVAPRRRGATVLTQAVTTATDEPCDFARGQPTVGSGGFALVSQRPFLDREARKFPACKALKTQEMRKLSPSSVRAKRENGLLPRGQARLRRILILSGHGISCRGRENYPGCKALKTHETRKSSPRGCEIKSSQRRRPGGDRRG